MNFRRLDMRGADSHDFAHRMFSRNIRTLPEGHGTLSLFLSAEAKVQTLFWITKNADGLTLLVPEPLAEKTRDLIEKYHFAEKFETILGPVANADPKAVEAFERMTQLTPQVLETPLVFAVGLEDLCDSDKGCYIGQEIVERVRSRKRKS